MFKKLVTINLIIAWTGIVILLGAGLVTHAKSGQPAADLPLASSEPSAATPEVSTSPGAPTPSSGPATGPTASKTSPTPTPTGAPASSAPKPGTATPPPITPTTPAPGIGSFTVSPASIAYNSSSTLSWTSTNATSCSISPSIGTVPVSGSRSTGALTASRTYTLTCTGNGTASRSAQVSVGAAPAACGSAGGACTTSQVATHNSAGNCWVIYNNSYYIVTSYVSQHPGGTSVFNSTTCGHDITSFLSGSSSTAGQRHTHSSSAYTILNSYKVGPVQ